MAGGRAARLAFVTHSSDRGGAELGLERLLAQVDPSDIEMSLIVLDPRPLVDWTIPKYVRVFQTSSDASPRNALRNRREILSMLDELDADFVVANSLSAAQYLSLVPKRSREYIYYLRQEAIPDGMAIWNRTYWVSVGIYRFERYLANSQWAVDTLPPRLRSKATVIYTVSGVNAVKSEPTESIAGQARPLRVLSLSRLSRWKGIHTAIEAAKIASDAGIPVELTVAGGNPFEDDVYEQELRKLALDLGTAVNFVGTVSDVASLILASEVVVCLSTTAEPFGQVIIQGLAHGRIVIATDHGGPREIIEDEVSGFLVAPTDPQKVAEVYGRIARNDSLRKRIGRNAAERARTFFDSSTVSLFVDAVLHRGEKRR